MNDLSNYELIDQIDLYEAPLKRYFLENDIHLFNDRINWVFKPFPNVYAPNENGIPIIFKGNFRPIWELEGRIPKAIAVKFVIKVNEENHFNILDILQALITKIIQWSLPIDKLDEVLNTYQQQTKVNMKEEGNKLDVSIYIIFKKKRGRDVLK